MRGKLGNKKAKKTDNVVVASTQSEHGNPAVCHGTSNMDVAAGPQGMKRPRHGANYGSVGATIAKAMSVAQNSVSDCQRALETLSHTGSIASPTSVIGKSIPLSNPWSFKCHFPASVAPLQSRQAGETPEEALELDGDDEEDDDVEVLAFTPGALLKGGPYLKEKVGGINIEEAFLTPDDIIAHQSGKLKRGPPEDIVALSGKLKIGTPEDTGGHQNGKRKRGSTRKVELDHENEDADVVETPKGKKKPKAIVEAEDDGPDRELVCSGSDWELEPEIAEDPLAEMWTELRIMSCQEDIRTREDTTMHGCQHTFDLPIDVGRACSQCGLIKGHRDYNISWHRPRSVRKISNREGQIVTWGDDAEGQEQEERRLGMPKLEIHPTLEDSMHPHQLEGFKFLSRNLVEEDSGGCMLAFAPGTGKSFLVISFIQSFMVQVPNARPMVVAPKGMLHPWRQEFKKWEVEDMSIHILYEASTLEDQLKMLRSWQETSSVLLVGYSQFINMSGEVGRLLIEGPGLLILDEGHLARTDETKILKSLTKVQTKRRVLLSGTPFNNNFDEFYNTLELVRPNFMQRASKETFSLSNTLTSDVSQSLVGSPAKKPPNPLRRMFCALGEKIESGNLTYVDKALQQLRELIEPFVAWHKGQILKSLPGIFDFTIMLNLTDEQVYLLKRDKTLAAKDNLQKRPAAIYVHPVLLLDPEIDILKRSQDDSRKRSQDDPRLRGDIDVSKGAKLRWVLDLVELCNASNEKLLIFSEYLFALTLIENMICERMHWSKGLQVLRLEGKMSPESRDTVVNKFNQGADARVLTASIKACGEGISLVGASRVVLLEVPWNPAVARQAISRAFRIGQQNKVYVYRLVAANTYEEDKMHEVATQKEWLSRLLFDPTISCDDYKSILWDVTDSCVDRFLKDASLKKGVNRILQREF